MVDEQRTLIDTIYRRKRTWIGHVVRGDDLMKLLIISNHNSKFDIYIKSYQHHITLTPKPPIISRLAG